MTRLGRHLSHLGYFGCAILTLCAYNLGVGAGTLRHLSGHPEDAPHLHAPDVARGWVWIATALAAAIIVTVASRQHGWRDAYRAALVLLVIMPAVRGVSYVAAWVLSWSVWGLVDGRGLDWWEEGSPAGWYTCLPWVGEVILVIFLAKALGRARE